MESSSYKLSSGQFAKRKYLGEGGFGTVWKCWKRDTKEFVAVKVLKHNHNAIKEVGHASSTVCPGYIIFYTYVMPGLNTLVGTTCHI